MANPEPQMTLPRSVKIHCREFVFCRRSARRAFTLLEVLLVLAILAALAGLAAPTIDSMITSRKLSVAADQIANDIAEGRIRAIQTGQTLGGRNYTVKPWLTSSDEINASAGATITTSTGLTLDTSAAPGGGVETSQSSGATKQLELDSYVQFIAVETLMDTRSAAAIQTETGSLPASGSGAAGSSSNPVLIYPDGSSTTAQIILVDQKGRRMVVQLRGIVGQLSKYQTTSVDPSAFVPAQ
jgi:prepilin-type N-terminal cleavage/methylation domain-containing protein